MLESLDCTRKGCTFYNLVIPTKELGQDEIVLEFKLVIRLDLIQQIACLYKTLIYFILPRKVMQETLFHQCNHCLKKTEEVSHYPA